MRRSTLISRSIFVAIVLLLFTVAAVYLINKQRLVLNYLSFQVESAEGSLIVPDIDRLVDKIESVDDLEVNNWPEVLKSGLNKAITKKEFSFNRELSKDCFISFNSTDYVVVFNTTSSVSYVVGLLNDLFETTYEVDGNKVTSENSSLFADHYGNYLVFSSSEVNLNKEVQDLQYGNADYVLFDQSFPKGQRHILSKRYHFRLWEESAPLLKGRPVQHTEYFSVIPSAFDRAVFYGSNRMREDVSVLFSNPSPESFEWLNDGLIYIAKDSFEIVLALQGDSRDLSLMLEEQTLEVRDDSAQLTFFNVSNFKVMPFETSFNWNESIHELNSPLRYYTEYNNFNVMTNSIPAMRWYLGQVQLGNLLGNNEQVLDVYQACLPEVAHYVEMLKTEGSEYKCLSKVYEKDSIVLITEVESGQSQVQMEGVEIVTDFEVNIVPSRIQVFKEKESNYVLLNNLNQISRYTFEGEKLWSLTLSTPMVEKPQLVDFDNNGIHEYVLFQQDQIDVVDSEGHSIGGFPVKLGGNSKAGIAVNYDNKYKYRIIVNVGNAVKVYSEEGKIVEGWQFKGMNAPLKGKIYHVLTQGKDIITFKDQSNIQHVLNRRGEYRIQDQVQFSLSNETDFVTGSMESSLRKMGYRNGFIYNYYILDGAKDSVAIDQVVAPITTYWEYNNGKPMLILEEAGRLLIANEYGYIMSEVLKPNQSNEFIGLVGDENPGFLFADNSQNTIYLLNNFGKMILPTAVEGSAVSVINENLLYTFSGISLKAYKIAD